MTPTPISYFLSLVRSRRCLIWITFIFILPTFAGCGNKYYMKLTDEHRRNIHAIAYTLTEYMTPTTDIQVMVESKPNGETSRQLIGGNMKEYRAEFAYIADNLENILPPPDRSAVVVPALFSSLASPADPIRIVRADPHIAAIWNSKDHKTFRDAIQKSEPFLKSQGCDAVLVIRVFHKVSVKGVYAGYSATLWQPGAKMAPYGNTFFSETVPLTDQQLVKASYRQAYREMLNKATTSVYHEIMGRQQ